MCARINKRARQRITSQEYTKLTGPEAHLPDSFPEWPYYTLGRKDNTGGRRTVAQTVYTQVFVARKSRAKKKGSISAVRTGDKAPTSSRGVGPFEVPTPKHLRIFSSHNRGENAPRLFQNISSLAARRLPMQSACARHPGKFTGHTGPG